VAVVQIYFRKAETEEKEKDDTQKAMQETRDKIID
jgi:hypothetical protein